jgi:hypothetical protein
VTEATISTLPLNGEISMFIVHNRVSLDPALNENAFGSIIDLIVGSRAIPKT